VITVEDLQRDYADKLPQWYCDLNCFRHPEGFPEDLGPIDEAHSSTGLRLAAWMVVSAAIGEEESSLAWWVLELGRTEEAWREWWGSRMLAR